MKAGQASTTAKVIAASTLLLATRNAYQHLLPSGMAALCQCFLSSTWEDRCLAASATSPLTQWLWRSLEVITHPGIMQHYLLRKKWIEDQCCQSLGKGVQRIIVIGAGLDTLTMRLAPQWPNVTWIEIDHHTTQDFKLQGLYDSGLRLPPNLEMYGLDLSTSSLPSHLMQDPKSTLVVIEGVLMYLEEANIKSLLRYQVRGLSSLPVQLIFSYMVRWSNGLAGFRPSSWLIDRWLLWRGESFKWTMPPQALETWLKALGFALVEQAESPFSKQIAVPNKCLMGENIVSCLVAHSS